MHFFGYRDFVKDMVAKRDRYKKQGQELLQTLTKKIAKSVSAGNIRQDVNDQFKCVTDKSVEENYDDRIKERWQYFHEKHWSTFVDNGFVGKALGLGKNDQGNAGIFYA